MEVDVFNRWIVALLTFCASAPAWAAEGVIVQREGDEIVIDLGSKDGLRRGTTVAVYRRLEVVHPITKKKIEDRFPIGMLQLDEVGENLSIVRDWAPLERDPEAGDFVVFDVPPTPTPTRAPEGADKPGDSFDAAFRETLGRSLHDRVETWQAFLRRNPDSPWTEHVNLELRWLRATISGGQGEQEETPPPPELRVDGVVAMPGAVEVGSPIVVDVSAWHPDRVDRIRVNYRRVGDPTHRVLELQRSGDYNWSGELPADVASDATQLEYFAETIRRDGQLERTAVDSAPIVDIRRPAPDPLGPQDRSRAMVVADYVNFSAGKAQDEYSRFEANYRYAVDTWILSGFSAGVGVFRGAGASLAALNAGEPARASLLSYGFAQVDLQLVEYVGINARALVGNNQQLGPADSVFEDAFGLRGEMWFGQQEGTQLRAGAAFTDTIGAEAWVTLDIAAIERVPMSGEVVVTNLPVGEDLGVSLNYGAGWAFTDWFSLLGRVGWNARTISHHGPTAGIGTLFQW